jgi:hypothetical protein
MKSETLKFIVKDVQILIEQSQQFIKLAEQLFIN